MASPATGVLADQATSLEDPTPVIPLEVLDRQSDEDITNKVEHLFDAIGGLSGVTVTAQEGVVTLGGSVANESLAEQAQALAIRVSGVVTIRDEMSRTLAVGDNVRPLIDRVIAALNTAVKALPLLLVALALGLVIVLTGLFLARRQRLLRRVAPNAFLAELLAQAIRIGAFAVGLIVVLNLLGAGGMVTTIVGGAGVLGIAVGFAVRDTMDNYISSIMLSLRQPFRAKDHVVINDREGIVVRLTSRATILMTLDGNHLRIPNSEVFKGTILNYSTNPERRFDFALGIGPSENPAGAVSALVKSLESLTFVLREPAPTAMVDYVGDSSIVIKALAWVDQRTTNFGKARSQAIWAAMQALDEAGFTLPEPSYRLHLEGWSQLPGHAAEESESRLDAPRDVPQSASEERKPRVNVDPDADTDKVVDMMDVKPDERLMELVEEEVREKDDTDLLDSRTPSE